jgi:hypothetical protein
MVILKTKDYTKTLKHYNNNIILLNNKIYQWVAVEVYPNYKRDEQLYKYLEKVNDKNKIRMIKY